MYDSLGLNSMTPLAEHNSTVLKGSSVEYLNKNKEN